MNLENITELYKLISEGIKNLPSRRNFIIIRKNNLISSKETLKKIAFDSRRIDQEKDYNPRRNLQNYNRSEQFISQSMSDKLINLSKLHNILVKLKDQYQSDPEWLDSKARVLFNTIENGLRKNSNDGDFSDSQPSIGSLDYIEQILDVRYRLNLDNINKLAEDEIQGIILNKDENLGKNRYKNAVEITSRDVETKSYDSLMEKLFGGIKATKDNKTVERTVTITIRDSFIE